METIAKLFGSLLALVHLSLVKMLSGLNAFGISNIHEWEFKVRSCG